MTSTRLLEPANAGGANRSLSQGGSLIEQYSAWEYAWVIRISMAKLQDGMLQSASCSKTVSETPLMLLDDHLPVGVREF